MRRKHGLFGHKKATPPPAEDDEPVVEAWGSSEKKSGGAVSWDDLADDLFDDEPDLEEPTPSIAPQPEPATDLLDADITAAGETANQPDWARPNVKNFHEDLWPTELEGKGDDGASSLDPGATLDDGGNGAVKDDLEATLHKPRGALHIPDDLWDELEDEPTVEQDVARRPDLSRFDFGDVEIRQATAKGSRRLRSLEEE